MVNCPRCRDFYRNRYTLKSNSKYPKPICRKCRIELLLPHLESSKRHKKYLETKEMKKI